MQPLLQAIPTHIITGFLGAGKTTLIQSLLARKPVGERWAVLVNEFGQIGIDGGLLQNSDGEVFIKEVAGGCICCANFLPMQVALSQLLAKAKPDRLLIEPTGLGHPRQIVENLTESHWRSTLDLRATICVIDGSQLQDERVRDHESFRAQAEIADVLVFSKDDRLDDVMRAALRALAEELPPPPRRTVFSIQGNIPFDLLDLPRRSQPSVRRSLLHIRQTEAPETPPPLTPPYHYHRSALDREVGGWVFPADWRFGHDALLDLLLAQRLDRIKGMLNTERGWLNINLSPQDAGITSRPDAADNRLELIGPAGGVDWTLLEEKLMGIKA